MLTPHQSDIALLSLFYWGLSVVMLRIVIIEKRHLLYGASAGYLTLCALLGWKIEMKWLLAGSLLFMMSSMSITLWILLKQSRECMRDLSTIQDEEKDEEETQGTKQ